MTPVGSFVVAPDHPCLDGHFPGRPVVPGVVLLDRALRLILGAEAASGLPTVKFTRPVLPGQKVLVARAAAVAGRIAFVCSVDGEPVARGSVVLGPAR